ncbi:MAG: thiamine biosynthesis protein ApbE [Cytophagaceae bacterium SCN 52-12]|nr:MAG: thiamine biosynthesis protein ApbE [Cytophagaceae bacterium SCN 52-12]
MAAGSLTVGLPAAGAQVVLARQVTLMGSRFEITLTDKDSVLAKKHIDHVIAEVTRIENLISEWQPGTQVSEINRNAGIRPVKVDREVFDLARRAIAYSEQSQGAFDISIAAMDRLWTFDGSMTGMPSPEAIRKSVEKVGYRNIVLDSANSTVYLALKGMKIGFGSIGKGYAADKGRELMQSFGVQGGIVNASGDLSAWGAQPDRKPWKIGINHPFKPRKILKVFKIKEASVATSGSYERYAEIDGRRYSHIIDPKTGYPSTGLTSVTVTGPSAEFANALSTSVMVLGEKEGIQFLKRFPAYEYVVVTDTGKVIKG